MSKDLRFAPERYDGQRSFLFLLKVSYPTSAASSAFNLLISSYDGHRIVTFGRRRCRHNGRLYVAKGAGVGIFEEATSYHRRKRRFFDQRRLYQSINGRSYATVEISRIDHVRRRWYIVSGNMEILCSLYANSHSFI